MSSTKKKIYLDYAASTPLDKRVLKSMLPFLEEHFANPWSLHSEGRFSAKKIKESREKVAWSLGALPEEIMFTSGGTESNTLALRGLLDAFKKEKGSLNGFRCVLSAIEHPSVAKIHDFVISQGMHIDVVGVDHGGIVKTKELADLLTPKTIFVSIMSVNSEIGTIQPIKDIGKAINKFRKLNLGRQGFLKQAPFFHTDATQAILYVDTDVKSSKVDLLSVDGHKIYGPKGIGCLFIRKGTPIEPIFFGTKQNGDIRGGTPPTSLIVGLGEALFFTKKERSKYTQEVESVRNYFFEKIDSLFPEALINGDRTQRAASNVSVTFPVVNHEFLRVQLDKKGILCSTKSACLLSRKEGSHVLEALYGETQSALRFSLGKETTKKDIDRVIEILQTLV